MAKSFLEVPYHVADRILNTNDDINPIIMPFRGNKETRMEK